MNRSRKKIEQIGEAEDEEKKSKLTSFSVSAAAVKTADPIDTSCAVEASSTCTIVDVDAAIGSGPTVYANAGITAVRIGACRAVVTERWSYGTLVNVEFALGPGKSRRTQTRIFVDTVHTRCAILTKITRAIIDIFFAMIASKSCNKEEKKQKN